MNRRNFLGTLAAGSLATLATGPVSTLAAAPRSDLQITRVRVLSPKTFKNLAGPVGLAETIVAVETNAGITGYGQGGTPDLLRYAASLLIGQDPTRIEYHYQRMYRSSIYPAGRERIHAVGALDSRAVGYPGQAARSAGVPAARRAGARLRGMLPVVRRHAPRRREGNGEQNHGGRLSRDPLSRGRRQRHRLRCTPCRSSI